ncbi:hypothetical protein niasHT_002077 [Heterodera trifolii]|uniref:Reverse transcriptase domain-containing protein n=1 Tax=Heterodera trifolii TaxID=157864 RepID=A0ABD2K1Y6_9BILA
MNRCGEGRKMPNNGKMEEQQMRPSADCIRFECTVSQNTLAKLVDICWLNRRLQSIGNIPSGAHLPLHNIHWVRRIVQRCVWTKRQKLAPHFVYCDRLGLLAVTDEQQHFAQSVCRNKLKISIPISECYLISEDDFHYLLLWFHHCTTENDQLCAKLIKKCISLFSDHFSNFKWANSFICVAINLRRHTLTIKYDNKNVPGPTFTFNVTNPPDPLRVKVYGPEFFKGWCRPTDCASEGPKGGIKCGNAAGLGTGMDIHWNKLDIVTAWITKSVGPFNQGVIELLEEFTVCKTGDQLSADHARILKQFGHRLAQFRQLVVADQARILKQFGQQLAQFRVRLLARWSKKKGFEQIDEEADE